MDRRMSGWMSRGWTAPCPNGFLFQRVGTRLLVCTVFYRSGVCLEHGRGSIHSSDWSGETLPRKCLGFSSRPQCLQQPILCFRGDAVADGDAHGLCELRTRATDAGFSRLLPCSPPQGLPPSSKSTQELDSCHGNPSWNQEEGAEEDAQRATEDGIFQGLQ